MKMNVKKLFSKVRIFKRLKNLADRLEASSQLNDRLRDDNNTLKDQLMARRKTINLLGEKKKKGELYIAQLTKRRDEFLNRLSAIPDASITNFNDYKYWLSEPFIVDSYKKYVADKDAIDGMSAIKGFGEIIKKIDEKED